MPLVSMKEIIRKARCEGYAVGAFNPVDYLTMKAIVRAAEELDAPVIVQTSPKTVRYYGPETLFAWMNQLATPSKIPVVLHLDHGKELQLIKRCIEVGWTSVMIDASDKPFEENLKITGQVVNWAQRAGIDVEAELGEIGGVEEDIVVDESVAHLADPDKATVFCNELDLAVFAPAVGTAHGFYKGEPNIAFGLIDEIYRRTQTPLALHGGTGLSSDTVAKCIQLGCAKVNISTHLKHAFVDGFCDYHRDNPNDFEPLKLIEAQYTRCKALVASKIEEFGAAGKA